MSFAQEIGNPEEKKPPDPVRDKSSATDANGLFMFKQLNPPD